MNKEKDRLAGNWNNPVSAITINIVMTRKEKTMVAKTVLTSGPKAGISHRGVRHVRLAKQMKKSLLVTIIGFVLAALAANGAPQPLASTAVPVQAECDCRNLKALQRELRNAMKLRQAFRNKIPELRAMEVEGRASLAELQRWTESDARRGLEPEPGYTGPAHVEYKPWGDKLRYQDDERVTSKFTNEALCRRSDESAAALEEAKKKSACAGIAQAIQVHEDWHLNFCLRIGYRPYWLGMRGADRAQEEVEAYGAQIAVLRAEIAKVLEHTNVHIEYEVNTRFTNPPDDAITAQVVDNRADLPMSRVSVSGEMIKLEGQGNQTTNATLEGGKCRFTGGMPFTLPARVTMETDGLDVQIRYTVEGQASTLKSECTIEGQTSTAMVMPHGGGGNALVFNLPLENGAEKVFDHSTGEAAKIMAQAGVKMTGQWKIRLILCEQSK